jgi:thiol-disulfide isomerase/thioredoxin
MTDAYRRAAVAPRADQLLTKVIKNLESAAETGTSGELPDVLLQLQASHCTRQIRGGTEIAPDRLRTLKADLTAMLRRKLKNGLIPSDLEAFMGLGMALEENGEYGWAAEFYQAAILVVDQPWDKQVLALLQTMQAATRRLGMIGKPLSIAGTTPDGAAYDSTSCSGKVLLLDFWLPWNSKCRQQLPNVKRLYRRYHHRGFEVVAICPGADHMKETLERDLAQHDVPWTILLDGDKAIATRLGVLSIPTSILLDQDGKVVSLGASGHELSQCLERLLGKPYEQRWKAPPYSSERVTFVDLALHANQPMAKTTFAGWEGNNLAEVPKGEQTMAGVLFQITDQLIQLRGVHLEGMPPRVNDIVIEKSFRTLYVLHGTQWGTGRFRVEHGTVIGEMIVHYSDASSVTIPITYGENVRDWWNADHSKPTKFGAVAWDGVNAASKARNATIRLYVTAWDNPHQDKEVRAIDYVSNNTVSAPFCVAMSIE